MYNSLSQGQVCLWQTYKVDRLLRGDTDQQSLGIGHTHILRGEANQAAYNVEGIFASFNHPPQPVKTCVPLFREAFQRENTRAGQERAIYLEAGILSGCPNEGYNSSLDVWQNGILLRLIKAVNLIDE